MLPVCNYDRTIASTTLSFAPFKSEVDFHVRRESNQLLPILRIYPDLLEYIFILTANREGSIEYRQRAVLSYSQTCRYWRIVALSIKSLWNGLINFEGNSEEWNNELLRRSHPYPIVVDSTSRTRLSSRAISAELAHLERIRIYSVEFEASAWDILVEGLQHPAPLIESLSIDRINCRTSNFFNFPFVLPSTLFAGHAPHLKRLDMRHCLVDLQAPALRSLTNLSVAYLNPLIAPSPLGWLEHLSNLPSLTTLRLEECMSSQSHSALSSIAAQANQTNLPLLSMLNLNATLHDMHIFIEGLKFPVNCRFMMSCSKCYPGPELDVVLLAYIHRLDYELQLRPENFRTFLFAESHALIFIPQFINDSHMAWPAPVLDIKGSPECEDLESLFGLVFCALREIFSKLTSLELHISAVHPSLISCLVRATKLTELCNDTSRIMIQLLPQLQIIQPSGSIPLPALHTIKLSVWEVTAYEQVLLSFLTWRRMVGHPITRVLFQYGLVSDDTISDLQSLDIQVTRWTEI